MDVLKSLKNPFCEVSDCDGIMDWVPEKGMYVCRKCGEEFAHIIVSEGKNVNPMLDSMISIASLDRFLGGE